MEFCLKQGRKISDICLKQGQGMRGRAAPPHPGIYRVPPRDHTATQRKTKSKPLMSWTTVFRQILQLNIEPVSSLVYLFVTLSMLPKKKDILYISLFRVSHYDCGRKTWNISIMYIKRRSCLVLNLLFHNAISTSIMRLVLKVKYFC